MKKSRIFQTVVIVNLNDKQKCLNTNGDFFQNCLQSGTFKNVREIVKKNHGIALCFAFYNQRHCLKIPTQNVLCIKQAV